MIDFNTETTPASRLGIATKELQVRVVNFSPSGCLIETNERLDTGATASLRMMINGDEFVDDVQVVRCQLVEGAGDRYQVGVKFLWTAAADGRALRQLVWDWCREVAAVES